MTTAFVGFACQFAINVFIYWFAWQRGRKAGLREAQAEIRKALEQCSPLVQRVADPR